ncbi:MAG: copper homeostasis protein CutC [Metamycoplasmataceae bacterium]
MKTNKNITREACVETIEEAKYFIERGVDRFETCFDLSKGGLTPKIELFEYIKNNSDIHQVIMIRTNDNFYVNNEEINQMIKEIKEFKNLGATEFIFGFINKNNEIDIDACKELIKNLDGCKYDFHMAIDTLKNYKRDFPILIELGFNRVLTKGGNSPAIQNINSIKEIISEFSNQIEIIVGGSVTKDNFEEIILLTGATQVHGTKIA